MAQGKGSRWEVDRTRNPIDLPCDFKQLIPLGNETVITRTIRQLQGERITVVAKYGDFSFHLPPGIAIQELREPTGTILRGIWKIAGLWSADRIIILLGDVVYSNAMIDLILSDKKPFSFYGRLGANQVTGKQAPELFGINFLRDNRIAICRTLKSLWYPEKQNREVKLWDLYRELDSYDYLREIGGDWSDDTDSIEAYQQFFPKLMMSAIGDDYNKTSEYNQLYLQGLDENANSR